MTFPYNCIYFLSSSNGTFGTSGAFHLLYSRSTTSSVPPFTYVSFLFVVLASIMKLDTVELESDYQYRDGFTAVNIGHKSGSSNGQHHMYTASARDVSCRYGS